MGIKNLVRTAFCAKDCGEFHHSGSIVFPFPGKVFSIPQGFGVIECSEDITKSQLFWEKLQSNAEIESGNHQFRLCLDPRGRSQKFRIYNADKEYFPDRNAYAYGPDNVLYTLWVVWEVIGPCVILQYSLYFSRLSMHEPTGELDLTFENHPYKLPTDTDTLVQALLPNAYQRSKHLGNFVPSLISRVNLLSRKCEELQVAAEFLLEENRTLNLGLQRILSDASFHVSPKESL